MRTAVAIGAGCCMAVFIISLVVGCYFWIRASLNRRPGPSRRWYVTGNSLNSVLFEDELTPQGLAYRVKAFRALLIALVSFIILSLL
jgi:hypothetical protein